MVAEPREVLLPGWQTATGPGTSVCPGGFQLSTMASDCYWMALGHHYNFEQGLVLLSWGETDVSKSDASMTRSCVISDFPVF